MGHECEMAYPEISPAYPWLRRLHLQVLFWNGFQTRPSHNRIMIFHKNKSLGSKSKIISSKLFENSVAFRKLTNRFISSSCSGFSLLWQSVRFISKIKSCSGSNELEPDETNWMSLDWLLFVRAGLMTDANAGVVVRCSFFSWRFLLKK